MIAENKTDKSSGRSYSSPFREQKANQTKKKIIDATEKLLRVHGYTKTTISSIARSAGVAPQTIYAVFGSKVGILTELIDRVVFSPTHASPYDKAIEAENAQEMMQFAAQLCRQIYEALDPIYDILCGTTAIPPELVELEGHRQQVRRQNEQQYIERLIELGALKKTLDREQARDILWVLTGRPLYKMLVRDRGWSVEAYEKWLTETLSFALLEMP